MYALSYKRAVGVWLSEWRVSRLQTISPVPRWPGNGANKQNGRSGELREPLERNQRQNKVGITRDEMVLGLFCRLPVPNDYI